MPQPHPISCLNSMRELTRICFALLSTLLMGDPGASAVQAQEIESSSSADFVVEEAFNAPLGSLIAADRNGRFYSLDRETMRVRVFDEQGRFRRDIDLQFVTEPPDLFYLEVNGNGRIWLVANPTALFYFDDRGRLLRQEKLDDPRAFAWRGALDEMGTMTYVSRGFLSTVEGGGHTVVGRLDERGRESNFAFEIEDDEDLQSESFRRSMVLDVADDGRIWAVRAADYRIWELTPGGRVLTHLADEEVEADITERELDRSDVDVPRDLTRPAGGSRFAGVETRMNAKVDDFEIHGSHLWLLSGKDLDVIDPTTGETHTVALPEKFARLAVTDRFVVLLPRSEKSDPLVLDRHELAYRISEREASRQITREEIEPVDEEKPTNARGIRVEDEEVSASRSFQEVPWKS